MHLADRDRLQRASPGGPLRPRDYMGDLHIRVHLESGRRYVITIKEE